MGAQIDNGINQALHRFNSNLANILDNKGITATGEARKSLRVELDRGRQVGLSIGKYYIEFLDRGRGAGKAPPPENIAQWVRIKLGIQEDKEVKQLAFLIGRKIANEGTDIYKTPAKGIELDVLATDLIKELLAELPGLAKAEVLLRLRDEMRKHLKL